MRKIVVLVLALMLAGCAIGKMATGQVDPGMSQEQVVRIMGKPGGFQQRGEYIIYKYTDGHPIFGLSWEKTDYLFIFKDDKLIEYGTGVLRDLDVGGKRSGFILQK